MQELVDSVAARYASLQTYHDQGALRRDAAEPVDQHFETFFSRAHGFKFSLAERQLSARPRSFVVWDDFRCASAYQGGLFGLLVECGDGGPRRVGLARLAQLVVPRYFFPDLQRSFMTGPRWREVEQGFAPDGRPAYVLIEEPHPTQVWKTWIEPTSRHIVRFEELLKDIERRPDGATFARYRVTAIDYDLVEIDKPIAAADLRFTPPFYRRHLRALLALGLSVPLLGLLGFLMAPRVRAYVPALRRPSDQSPTIT